MSAALPIALGVELPPALAERIRRLSPRVELWTPAELERDPSGWRQAEAALISGWLEQERLRDTPALRWVQTIGAGVERLLTPEIVARAELVVTNASGIHAQPIAEHTFGFLLAFTRNLHLSLVRQHEAQWNSQPYRETVGTLAGKTLGVLGLGAIGERVAAIGAAFGLRVIGLKRRRRRRRTSRPSTGPTSSTPSSSAPSFSSTCCRSRRPRAAGSAAISSRSCRAVPSS